MSRRSVCSPEVFERFASLLDRRIAAGAYTTEDAVRYTFVAALLEVTGLELHGLLLEYPHPGIMGAEIDLYLKSTASRNGLVLECKYDRSMPSGRNSPRTQKAGKLLNDFDRLARFSEDPSADRCLVYLTDKEMAGYLRNPSNRLTEMMAPTGDGAFDFTAERIRSLPPTLRAQVSQEISCTVQVLYAKSISSSHYVAVYRVNKGNYPLG